MVKIHGTHKHAHGRGRHAVKKRLRPVSRRIKRTRARSDKALPAGNAGPDSFIRNTPRHARNLHAPPHERHGKIAVAAAPRTARNKKDRCRHTPSLHRRPVLSCRKREQRDIGLSSHALRQVLFCVPAARMKKVGSRPGNSSCMPSRSLCSSPARVRDTPPRCRAARTGLP